MTKGCPTVCEQTPSQQSSVLDNGQDEGPGSGQWNPYPLGRRDVPPDTVSKKVSSAAGEQGGPGVGLGDACLCGIVELLVLEGAFKGPLVWCQCFKQQSLGTKGLVLMLYPSYLFQCCSVRTGRRVSVDVFLHMAGSHQPLLSSKSFTHIPHFNHTRQFMTKRKRAEVGSSSWAATARHPEHLQLHKGSCACSSDSGTHCCLCGDGSCSWMKSYELQCAY